MLIDDTIAAISTAPGVGAIAIVRLSGPAAFAICERIFSPRTKPEAQNSPEQDWHPKSHQATIGYIQDPGSGALVDEVVLIPYKGPNSYTGEDLVEINCHGSPIVTREILALSLKYGARLAQAGEFTKRGFLAGRLDLTQAEAVLDLIHSKTERGSHLALTALTGHLGQEIKAVRSKLIELLTRITAGIDFPEEVGELDISDIESITNNCIKRLEVLARTARSGRYLREGLKLAIVGKPNVGKSSLLNRLLDFERAIVTDIPGTTRDSIEEPVDVRGIPVILIDTAGVRETTDVVEKIGIDRTQKAMHDAELVILMMDGQESPGTEEEFVAKRLDELKRPFILAINKCDLLDQTQQKDFLSALSKNSATPHLTELVSEGRPHGLIFMSAKEAVGLEDLKGEIERFALKDNSIQEVGGTLNQRQGELCIKALGALTNLLEAAQAGLPQDCLATDLKVSVDALDEISGHHVTEEVITEVFANFCIGK